MIIHKNIVIGSGPSAVGALLALKNKKITLITGESFMNNNNTDLKNIHPKIRYNIQNKSHVDKDHFFFKKKSIFSIAQKGGLANYWGQGFDYVDYDKIYSKKIFKNKKNYLNIILKLYKFFNIKKQSTQINFTKKINIFPSPLVKENFLKKNLHLNTMKESYEYLKKKNKIKEYNFRVIKISLDKNIYKLTLSNSKIIYGKNIFLAAGVIGNSKILFNSDNNIQCISFNDDCPWIIYALIFQKKIRNFIDKSYSTIGKTLDSKNFFSIYNLSKINLHFIFFYLFKLRLFGFLKKIKINIPFLNIFQLWNTDSIVKIYLKKNNTFFSITKKNLIPKKFIKILNKKNIFKIFYAKTPPGEGFHYHNINIQIKNKFFILEDYLKNKFNKNLICIDSSVEKKINPGPFTATQMAIAFKKLELFFQK